jgi:hypothetical protein
LYDVIADLSRQIGMVFRSENMKRLQDHPNLADNGNFLLDLHLLFSSRFKKGENRACYFGKDLDVLQRKFQDRDFKNSKLVHLTERLTLSNLCTLFREGLWKNTLEGALLEIRKEKKLDTKQ